MNLQRTSRRRDPVVVKWSLLHRSILPPYHITTAKIFYLDAYWLSAACKMDSGFKTKGVAEAPGSPSDR